MLKRVYVDNFRCLVDFEYCPGSLDLLAGGRGSGRSSLRTILERVRSFVAAPGDSPKVWDEFWLDTRTRWQGSTCLCAVRSHPESGEPIPYELDALSNEEQLLIQIYALVHFATQPGHTLLVDAPHGALSTAEVRRWMGRLLERAEATSTQVLVVAEDPELLRDLPTSTVRRFERTGGGPTTVSEP